MYNLVQKKSNVGGLKAKAEAILEKIPKVQELEWTLGLPEDVKDEELVTVTNSLQKGLQLAQKKVKEQAFEEAKEAEAKAPKP